MGPTGESAIVRNLVEKMALDHRFTAVVIKELVSILSGPTEQRQFGIKLAANLSKEALDLLAVLGETAKMVKHNDSWESFSHVRER